MPAWGKQWCTPCQPRWTCGWVTRLPHATVPHTAANAHLGCDLQSHHLHFRYQQAEKGIVHGNVLVVGGSSRLAATACRRHCFRLQLPPAQAALPVCLSGKSLDVDRDFRAFSPKSGVSRANAPIAQVILPPLFPLKTRWWMQSDWRAQSVDVNGAGRARTVRQTD